MWYTNYIIYYIMFFLLQVAIMLFIVYTYRFLSEILPILFRDDPQFNGSIMTYFQLAQSSKYTPIISAPCLYPAKEPLSSFSVMRQVWHLNRGLEKLTVRRGVVDSVRRGVTRRQKLGLRLCVYLSDPQIYIVSMIITYHTM